MVVHAGFDVQPPGRQRREPVASGLLGWWGVQVAVPGAGAQQVGVGAVSAVIDSCVEEELRTGIPFDPVIKDSASFALERRYHSPFYENVAREAIPV